MATKKVLVLEDEPIIRKLLVEAVAESDHLEVVGQVASISAARTFLDSCEAMPDVLLADLLLPDGSAIELIRELKRRSTAIDVLVVSASGDASSVIGAIEAGASGYIFKDDPLHEMGNHVERILRGESPISPSVARHILKRMCGEIEGAAKTGATLSDVALTPREKDILQTLARGFSAEETATYHGMSPHTVVTHMKNIYKKLAVHSKTEAIFEACQLGLIQIRE